MSWVATGIVVSSAATGAGSYFSNKKVKPALATAPQVIGLKDTDLGKTISKRIMDALTTGTGIGYPAEYIDKATSPFVASREARYKSKELPFLSSQYAGRGMGRSSLAARDIGESFAQKERDINEVIANAYLQDLNQRKSDTQRYENLGTNYAADDAATFNQSTANAAGVDFANQQALQEYNQANRQNQSKAISGTVGSILGNSGKGDGGGGDMSSLMAFSNYLNSSPFTSSVPKGATSYGGGSYGKTTPYFLSPKWSAKSPTYA